MLTSNDIKFLRSLSSKRARVESGLFIAEGEKLVGELCETFSVNSIYRVGENCSENQMARISQLKTPTPTLGLFELPKIAHQNIVNHPGHIIALDGIQDPGNLGTIIRTADWFGIRYIVCSKDTADNFAPKVVQATMGAIGRVQLLYTNITEWLTEREKLFSGSTYGTFLDNSTDYLTVEFPRTSTIVMGNEGKGISPEVEQIITNRIHIKHGEGGAGESLNVAIATAIVLSHL